ncbi:MAG: ATP-binding cassette domain-containing protein [Bacteroidetes bacterium]|nr:ATP-binding cassette domain-containing protein [Bacteroidota bacterium]
MLEIKNISKTFNVDTISEVKSLCDISCTIETESFVILVGTNGSGKSTLLNAIAGNFFPDQGRILLDGIDFTRMPEHKRAKYIGRVFQNPFSGTAPDMTIAENLALAAKRGQVRSLGWALPQAVTREFRERVRPLGMELEDRLDSPIGKLSGGQRQALTLLMASWIKPKLLLLDEHTAALDPKTAAKVISMTEEVVNRERLTTLMVTHSMQQAVNMGTRILMLHKGRIVYDFSGLEKQRLKAADLLALFDEIRKKEQVDHAAAEMIDLLYV